MNEKNNEVGVANQTRVADTNLNISLTYKEVAAKLGLTVKEVKDAEASAFKKLRHPRIGKAIKDYLKI